jgi:soluble lytic murein transglycosylase
MRAAVVRGALGSMCASLLVAHGTVALAAGPASARAPAPVLVAQASSSAPAGASRVSQEMRDRFAAGLAARRAGDPGKAAREFADPAWAATPVADYAHLFLAQSLLASGDAAGARAAAARAVDAAPDGRPTASMLSQAAAVLSSAGDDGAAAALYRRFLERYADHPDAPRVRYALARSLLAARRVPEAARVLNELWVAAPASSFADEAARQLRILGEGGFGGLVPTEKERVERAERLLGAGRGDTAKSEADAVLDAKPSADVASRALRVVAESARRAGRQDAAIQVANRALAELPADRRAAWWLELARLQHKKSRDSALPTIDRIVRDDPKSAEAAEALELKARILEASGRSGDAEAVYQKLAAEHPDHDEGGAAAWRLGWISWFRGAYGDAAARWDRMAKARSGRAHRESAVYWIGRAHEQRGDGEAAARQFALVQADGVRSYYGILAARRGAAAPPPPDLTLPAVALEPIESDGRLARVEVLRGAGLESLAEEELDELARRSIGEPKRLYAVAAVYAQDARHHLALRILRRHFQPYARSGLSSLPRPFWEMFYPLGWRAEITDAAGRAAIDPLLVAAVVREESSYYPQARSRVGARGLMQLMPDTARPLAQARKLPFNNGNLLDDPAANVDMGSGYLSGLLREFGDARLAVAAYNAGPTRVREWWAARRSDDLEVWVEQIPFNETRAFVKRVMLSWEEYRRLYGVATGAEPPSPPVPPTKS